MTPEPNRPDEREALRVLDVRHNERDMLTLVFSFNRTPTDDEMRTMLDTLTRRDAPREGASEADIERRLDAMVEEYEWNPDGAGYTPKPREKMMLLDFAHGLLSDAELVALLRSHFAPDRVPREGGEARKVLLADHPAVPLAARLAANASPPSDAPERDTVIDWRWTRGWVDPNKPPTDAPSDAVGALVGKDEAFAREMVGKLYATAQARHFFSAGWDAALGSRPVVDEAMVGRALMAPYRDGNVSDMLRGGGDEEAPIMRAALTAALRAPEQPS